MPPTNINVINTQQHACVGVTCFPVAAGCSAAGIGRPSAGIGRVISGEIGRSWLESPEILGRRGRARALTAAPAGGKLILPRFGEALTLRLSPRGISLSVNGGGDLRAATTVFITASGRASWGRFSFY